MSKSNIHHFSHLFAWQKNHQLVLNVYKITKDFPREEQFGLTQQIRRSASSITANVAEGYGRYHYKDKIRFYYNARGSNTETQNHLILAKDLGYLKEKDYQILKEKVFEGFKLISGLIKSTDRLNIK